MCIRYRKTSQTRDVKSHSTKRSVRKLAQPKLDSAFEQKTRFVSSRETSGSSQNIVFSYNQGKKQSRAQKVIFGMYSRSFWKFTVFLKKQAVFISIRYHNTSRTQDVKSQSNKPSLRKLAKPKRDSAFEQKTRFVPSRETSGSSQNIIFSYNQWKKQSRAQTDTFGTYSTSFWEVYVFLPVRLPIIFRKVCTKIIKTIVYNTKRRRPHFWKNQKLFLYVFVIARHLKRGM